MKFKIKDILGVSIAVAILYNMVVLPVAAAYGLPLPPLVIDEATKFLMMIGGLGG